MSETLGPNNKTPENNQDEPGWLKEFFPDSEAKEVEKPKEKAPGFLDSLKELFSRDKEEEKAESSPEEPEEVEVGPKKSKWQKIGERLLGMVQPEETAEHPDAEVAPSLAEKELADEEIVETGDEEEAEDGEFDASMASVLTGFDEKPELEEVEFDANDDMEAKTNTPEIEDIEMEESSVSTPVASSPGAGGGASSGGGGSYAGPDVSEPSPETRPITPSVEDKEPKDDRFWLGVFAGGAGAGILGRRKRKKMERKLNKQLDQERSRIDKIEEAATRPAVGQAEATPSTPVAPIRAEVSRPTPETINVAPELTREQQATTEAAESFTDYAKERFDAQKAQEAKEKRLRIERSSEFDYQQRRRKQFEEQEQQIRTTASSELKKEEIVERVIDKSKQSQEFIQTKKEMKSQEVAPEVVIPAKAEMTPEQEEVLREVISPEILMGEAQVKASKRPQTTPVKDYSAPDKGIDTIADVKSNLGLNNNHVESKLEGMKQIQITGALLVVAAIAGLVIGIILFT